ncbi:DUF202 domain-containing protein [Sphingomonas sp. ID1715]|uniref:YidH family protein n=1 Tax=Sphingomonas sp. ID1715 TaxID=1656898 RepID=UPI001487C65E|nr:DUF202 domain-containing protein [Sphingomonas sp. ID1715]NNM77747.1 DUF202 domain-containing protein [Sphingomonas sp. ID1715]
MNAEPEKRAAAAQAKLAASAGKLEKSAVQQVDSADRRTELAADRTVLAAERTYAAWIRTGLAALAAGIGTKALLQDLVADWLIFAATLVLIVFSIFCFLAAVWRQIDRSVPPPRPDTRTLPSWLLVGFSGFLAMMSVAALIGIWSQ